MPSANPAGNSLARHEAAPANGRAGLLDAIKGFGGVKQLHKADERELAPAPAEAEGDPSNIANALRMALASRQTAMRAGESSDEEEEAGDDDDW